jgi:hypothetical protein
LGQTLGAPLKPPLRYFYVGPSFSQSSTTL